MNTIPESSKWRLEHPLNALLVRSTIIAIRLSYIECAPISEEAASRPSNRIHWKMGEPVSIVDGFQASRLHEVSSSISPERKSEQHSLF